jgi:hypothetical protein
VEKGLVVGPAPGTVSEVDISGYQEIEHQHFRVRGAKLHVITTHKLSESRKDGVDIGVSEFRIQGLRQQALNHRIRDIAKSDSPKLEGGISQGFTVGVDFLKGK